jgi:hypothetical protein
MTSTLEIYDIYIYMYWVDGGVALKIPLKAWDGTSSRVERLPSYRLSLCKGYLMSLVNLKSYLWSSPFNVWWMKPLENNLKVPLVPKVIFFT